MHLLVPASEDLARILPGPERPVPAFRLSGQAELCEYARESNKSDEAHDQPAWEGMRIYRRRTARGIWRDADRDVPALSEIRSTNHQ